MNIFSKKAKFLRFYNKYTVYIQKTSGFMQKNHLTFQEEAWQKLASEYKKTSISAVGGTRFPMSWVIIKKNN